MPITIAPSSNDTELRQLMNDVDSGKIQLPDFQRGWTWDDDRIRGMHRIMEERTYIAINSNSFLISAICFEPDGRHIPFDTIFKLKYNCAQKRINT